MIVAMNLLLLIIGVAVLTGLAWTVAALYETLTHDGYGRRPAPRSHRREEQRWNPPYAA